MTDIPVISNSVSQTVSTSNTVSSNATLSSDFETFLEMLTAQARYQDPLDPISSSDHAAQLAQFSMVEQQVFTNEQLGALTNALGGSTIGALSGWVGMEVRAASSVQFDGAPVTISANPARGADRVQLAILNDFGSEVGRRDIPLSDGTCQWDGRDQTGQLLGNGVYRFAVESFSQGELISSEAGEVYGRVVEAQVVGGETSLKLADGTPVRVDQVTALREPQ